MPWHHFTGKCGRPFQSWLSWLLSRASHFWAHSLKLQVAWVPFQDHLQNFHTFVVWLAASIRQWAPPLLSLFLGQHHLIYRSIKHESSLFLDPRVLKGGRHVPLQVYCNPSPAMDTRISAPLLTSGWANPNLRDLSFQIATPSTTLQPQSTSWRRNWRNSNIWLCFAQQIDRC